jgi:succinate dehydrogenase / fumarate reductase iron-sulfur subunit
VEVNPNERLLDALMQVKRFQDGSLGFRKSCAHGVCGSDAMRINGKNGLACKTLIKDVAEKEGDTITSGAAALPAGAARPDRGSSGIFRKVSGGQALLINEEPVAEKERIQSQEERLQVR